MKQAEWNILQMGTTKYETSCKQIKFKNVYLETTHLSTQKTIPLMTDQVIDVRLLHHRYSKLGCVFPRVVVSILSQCLTVRNSDEMIIRKTHPTLLMSFQSTIEALVDYTNPLLNSYRSFTHDAILIHGFIPEKAATGTLKALFTISDGIRFVKNFDCRINWYFKWMGRMVRSMFEDMWFGNWSTKQNVFVWYSEIWWHFNRQQILQYSWMLVRLGKLWRL